MTLSRIMAFIPSCFSLAKLLRIIRDQRPCPPTSLALFFLREMAWHIPQEESKHLLIWVFWFYLIYYLALAHFKEKKSCDVQLDSLAPEELQTVLSWQILKRRMKVPKVTSPGRVTRWKRGTQYVPKPRRFQEYLFKTNKQKIIIIKTGRQTSWAPPEHFENFHVPDSLIRL